MYIGWDEIDILKTIHTKAVAKKCVDIPVVRLLDYFIHTGPNGGHVCFIFEMLGNNLLKLIKDFKYEGRRCCRVYIQMLSIYVY